MLINNPSKFGIRYPFSPYNKRLPAEILLVGVTLPHPEYKTEIDNRDHSIESCQFEYVVSGSGYIECNGSQTPISAGDLLIISSTIPRAIFQNKNDPLKKNYVTVRGPFINAMLESYGFTSPVNVVKADVECHFDAIINEIEKTGNQTPELCNFIICEIFKIVQKAYDASSSTKIYGKHTLAEEIGDYLINNLHRTITLKELCDHFYLGKTQIIKIFKLRYGATPMSFLQNIRMSTAMRYINHTDMPISRISEQLGYSDSGYFAKVFEKYYGTTPLAHRKAPGEARKSK